MNTKFANMLMRIALGASIALLPGLPAVAATVAVSLTAQQMTATLPDGAQVKMWGYCTTGSCTTAWAPGPTITATAGDTLNITLTNGLPTGTRTSIVILGQLGGGLGDPMTKTGRYMASPSHPAQTQTTWPANGAPDPAHPFTPPDQGQRVRSFGTEVASGGSGTLTWGSVLNPLKAGTYLYEAGTLPSIQVPMGLYGVLVVNAAPGVAYTGINFDADQAFLFSEIDPVQNAAVDNAALHDSTGANITKRFDDASCVPNCYPAAVNYSPTYFLINGKSFNQASAGDSAFNVANGGYVSGHMLVRLLNAGSRTHIPSIVGLPMSIVAEDGNLTPGNPKVQNEVLLTAGKTHDVLVSPAQDTTDTTKFADTAFPVFDRMLNLSAANQLNAGMRGYLKIGAGALPAFSAAQMATPTVVNDAYVVPPNTSINGNVRNNDIAVTSVAMLTLPTNGTLVFNADGSFVYSPNSGYIGSDSFTYSGNLGTAGTATVALNVGNAVAGSGPTANADSYTSNISGRITIAAPGVLANDTESTGLLLTAALASKTCASVTLNADGSFTATNPSGTADASCSFTYTAVNSRNAASAAATVNVTFKGGSGLVATVVDPNPTDPTHPIPISDYRWIIQEDLTFKVDPTGTPSLSTRTLGTSFHKSHMTVVATGCVGDISCRSGQTSRGVAVNPQDPTPTTSVYLDPSKHYYISVLPGDAAGTDTSDGHAMGGAEIKPSQLAVTINANAYPYEPSQLSVYIYEDNAPTNNQDDQDEVGLGGFNIILMDAVGRSGDVAGQQTYDASGMPLSNALLGRPGCPDDQNIRSNGTGTSADGNLVGVVYTCPSDPNEGTNRADPVKYALAGHALIKNLTPARYDVIAHPAAARQGKGEVWWQVETLEGTPAQDAFNGVKEPVYFQEFGPPGFHTTIGFVNPDHVKKFASDNKLVDPKNGHTITGTITNQHMSRPSDVTLWDSGSYDLLASTTCQVALNSQGGTGPAVAIAQCDPDGNFTLTGIPAGDYELAIWDQWLDQIIQFKAITVAAANVALGNIPVLSWFTQYNQNIYLDANNNGKYDTNEAGISNLLMTTRYRDGGISNQTATDSSGNGLLAELFPLFNWYVTEADTTRFKQTGVNVIVDAGGQTDTTGAGAGLWNSNYADCTAGDLTLQPCISDRVEQPGALSYGLQGFISQRSTINWGRAPYLAGENGGIQGIVVYSTTRPFDDQRYNVQTLWEPLTPRVTVNLYLKGKAAGDGSETLTLVDTTQTTSWDDFVNAVDTSGKQTNLQCPGQNPNDPFFKYTLNGTDQFRCYDGWHNWNQVQAAPYDGRYQFPSANCTGCVANLNWGQHGSPARILPPGEYVVEAVTPPGYEIVKEEDKNILNGDSFVAPAAQQFAGITNVFILPDQATLNNANPYAPLNADGIANNATSNLGVTASSVTFPECVGALHRVPDFLSLFPQGGLVAPFAGMDRPLCDRKLVALNDGQQASATFYVFTEVPMAANGTGIILDDASSEFNAAAPDFGEKASVPFVPVSIKDFNGREISRAYSDQWGAYNVMTPSSWLVNPPTPSGYGPNMLVTCMNDPGPIKDPVSGKMITDPQYNAAYSNFCYTLPFMPGRTTYLDTPVLPIAAFASGYNPADCAYPDATPAIARVDSSSGFGPWVPSSGARTLTITAVGTIDVPNPGYAGPFADPNTPANNPASKRSVSRHYGFGGTTPGTVTIGGVAQPIASWTDDSITVNVAAGTLTGELVVTTAAGKASVDAVTVTVGGKVPTRVDGANGDTIQTAIDAATPGDLILVNAGTYNELLIMWKPVRLQGVGAPSVIINAAKYPTSKLENWRPTINSLFAIDTTTGNQVGTAQVDPLPTQEITGGIVLLEPSVLGTEEGAGVTVLAKNLPANQCFGGEVSTFGSPITDSNFLCAPSRIDGVSVTGGDAGGGIYVNGWAHGLEISNNRIYGNAGAFHGGVRVGVPYLDNELFPGQSFDANGNIVGSPSRSGNLLDGFGYDKSVKIHHNAITKNGTVEAPNGNGGAGGGVSICSGTDGYSVDHNWICGNISSSDGGGIGHIGFSQSGRIANNQILFNQSFQQTTSVHGGGIVVTGEPAIAGTLTLGTGSLLIDSNTIRGNFAEVGHGGGISLRQVNGADVDANPNQSSRWHAVTITNNIIDNNIAGYAGGGIALADTLTSSILNNTISSNDSVGIAGTVLAGNVPLPATVDGIPGTGKPSPAGIVSELTSAQLLAALPNNNSRAANRASNPTLTNNIVWKNRSFFYKVVGGQSVLCSSNNVADAGCNQLLPQAATGACMNAGTGAPKYWEIGVLGDASATPGTTRLNPTYSDMTSLTGYPSSSHNLSTDPRLTDMYCNGSRVTPEYAGVINPPSVKSLDVAATVDEGNNYVNLRYGPLYLSKPTASAGTAFAAFGDYHLAAGGTSGAVDHGQTLSSITVDIDAEHRPYGTAYDIGADELALISLVPGVLDFGSVQAGSSKTLAVTLTNKQAISLNPAVTFSSSASSAVFTQSNNCGGNLAAGASCVINVTFTPGSSGSKSGTMTLAGQSVSLSGTGTSASASLAGGVAFGDQVLNTTSPEHVFTYTNTGFGPITVTAASLSSTMNYALTGTNTCTGAVVLLPSDICQVGVTFTPTTVASNLGTILNVTTLGNSANKSVNLSGNGINPLAFSWTNGGTVGSWGNSSSTRTITVTNLGTSPLTLVASNAVVITGSQFSRATGSNAGTCANMTVLAGGGTCTVGVRRVRPSSNPRAGTGNLTISLTAPYAANPQVLSLSGN